MSVDSATLERRRARTAKARETFELSFATPEEKSAHFRRVAEKASRRVVLPAAEAEALIEAYALLEQGEDAAALGHAYALLGKLADRARRKLEATPI